MFKDITNTHSSHSQDMQTVNGRGQTWGKSEVNTKIYGTDLSQYSTNPLQLACK